jgi:hypothetical protein
MNFIVPKDIEYKIGKGKFSFMPTMKRRRSRILYAIYVGGINVKPN